MKSWTLRIVKYRKTGKKYFVDIVAPKSFIKLLKERNGKIQAKKLFYSITGKKFIEL